MSRLLVALLVLVAGVAGFLVGRSGAGASRSDGRAATETSRRQRSAIRLPADELDQLYRQSALVDDLVKENKRLRERIRTFEPTDDEPEVGERLPDNRIVGGARFSPGFQQLAMGFMDTMLSQFIKEANLTPEQERRLREEIRTRSRDFMAALADFTNGDITGEQAYEAILEVNNDGRKLVNQLLDEKQIVVFESFRRVMKGIMHAQVVGNELTLLRSSLGLDSEQEKKVKTILDRRYKRVQERIPYPLPNVFFKIVRSGRDKDIYDETSAEIAKLLTPGQADRYAGVEKKAAEAPFAYRNMLVPK